MSFRETEEWMMYHAIIQHYANQVHEARQKVEDLQRRLDAANERMALMESLAYGVSWL